MGPKGWRKAAKELVARRRGLDVPQVVSSTASESAETPARSFVEDCVRAFLEQKQKRPDRDIISSLIDEGYSPEDILRAFAAAGHPVGISDFPDSARRILFEAGRGGPW